MTRNLTSRTAQVAGVTAGECGLPFAEGAARRIFRVHSVVGFVSRIERLFRAGFLPAFIRLTVMNA
jgi:hypothetical protein